MGSPSCSESAVSRSRWAMIAHVDENLAKFLIAAFALQFEGAVEVFRRNQSAIDEKLSQWRMRPRPRYRSCSSIKAASSACEAWLVFASSSFSFSALMNTRCGRLRELSHV